MSVVKINYMRFFDQSVLRFLIELANNDTVHVNGRRIAEKFDCHENTAYNTIEKLKSSGHLHRIGGCKRKGYVYRIVV